MSVSDTSMSAEEEAEQLLRTYSGDLSKCLDRISTQLGILQARSQLLLTVATLSLTISGFSGNKIVDSNLLSRYSLALGLSLMLLAIILLLVRGMQVVWVSQFRADTSQKHLVLALRYRNVKMARYQTHLTLIVAGFTAFVVSIIAYLLHHS